MWQPGSRNHACNPSTAKLHPPARVQPTRSLLFDPVRLPQHLPHQDLAQRLADTLLAPSPALRLPHLL